jgi:hypothetical protein
VHTFFNPKPFPLPRNCFELELEQLECGKKNQKAMLRDSGEN